MNKKKRRLETIKESLNYNYWIKEQYREIQECIKNKKVNELIEIGDYGDRVQITFLKPETTNKQIMDKMLTIRNDMVYSMNCYMLNIDVAARLLHDIKALDE